VPARRPIPSAREGKAPVAGLSLADLPVGIDTTPMEAKSVAELPDGAGWVFEPKWDGFRCLAFRAGADVDLRAKSGKPLARYFPEVVERLRGLPVPRFVLDGELVVPVGGALSFDALQMRLHPAESRIRRLSVETPAVLIMFDLLVSASGASLLDLSLLKRREALDSIWSAFGQPVGLRLSPFTRDRDEAAGWLAASGEGALDGVIAKPADEPYRPGERAMLKVKRLRSADCVVGGFRYASGKREVGSLLLGLYDEEGRLDHVGFTSNMPAAERADLTKRLEALVQPPGFTGKAPGGPSRWSTERSTEWQPLRPELVVEVRFDQVTAGRFRHGTGFLRWRPDKIPAQCKREQLQQPALPTEWR
jgi:ATP-dependent DNA ligase